MPHSWTRPLAGSPQRGSLDSVTWCTWAGGRLFSLLSRLGIWYGGFRVFTSSTISLLHLVPNMTCLWLSHWLQNTLFMLGCEMGYSFIMALLSMCLVAYSEVSRMFWNLLSVPRSLFMMQSTKLQEML